MVFDCGASWRQTNLRYRIAHQNRAPLKTDRTPDRKIRVICWVSWRQPNLRAIAD